MGILYAKDSGIVETPSDRWDAKDPAFHGLYCSQGGFIDNIRDFDADFFGISPREACNMDPQQRLLLELSWEALEDAAIKASALNKQSVGVFVGISSNDYKDLISEDSFSQGDIYLSTGNSHSIAAGRIAYTLGLRGPTVAVDTACSSSLVALHMASRSVRSGESSMALVGGINLLISPVLSVLFSKMQMLAVDGRCKTFDAKADGYVRGEGGGVIVLKRLDDALQSGDRVLAVLRGSAMNHDGRSNGLTAPSEEAQVTLIRQALIDAEAKAGDIAYIESHGTGTPLGDPIELNALQQVFADSHSSQRKLKIGSVKTNIGHLEAASGMAGLIKAILILNHKKIPAHLNFEQPNPHIDWDKLPISVVTDNEAFQDHEGLVGLSSFGFSGTNAHVILQAPPKNIDNTRETQNQDQLIKLSAKSMAALKAHATQLMVCRQSDALADIATTLNRGREDFDSRLAIIAANETQFFSALQGFIDDKSSSNVFLTQEDHSNPPAVVMLFSGQGLHYVGMGKALYHRFLPFKAAIDECAKLLNTQWQVTLQQVLFEDDDSYLKQSRYLQPALFSLEYALYRLYEAMEIKAEVMIGHSLGEYAMAVAAGVLQLTDAMQLLVKRAELMHALKQKGGMFAAFCSVDRVKELLLQRQNLLSIAAINGRESIVISGEWQALMDLKDELNALDIKTHQLDVSHAFHSPMLHAIIDDFRQLAKTITYHRPKCRVISTVSGDFIDDGMCGEQYWCDHILETVNFEAGMCRLIERDYDCFIEIGPGSLLSTMMRQAYPSYQGTWISSLAEGKDDSLCLLQSLATLYGLGLQLNWSQLNNHPGHIISLPNYPFERREFWLNQKPGKHNYRQDDKNPLLGERLRLPDNGDIRFEVCIGQQRPAYLADHRVFDACVFPASAFVEMTLSSSQSLSQNEHIRLDNFLLHRPLILDEGVEYRLQLVLRQNTSGENEFKIFSSYDDKQWHLHASGLLSNELSQSCDPVDINLLRIDLKRKSETADDIYQNFADYGLQYGPMFRGIDHIYSDDKSRALNRICLPELIASDNRHVLHPVLLDVCLQGMQGLFNREEFKPDDGVFIPVYFSSIEVYRALSDDYTAFIETSAFDLSNDRQLTANIQLHDREGCCVTLSEVVFQRIHPSLLSGDKNIDSPVSQLYSTWEPLSTQGDTLNPSTFLIYLDKQGLGHQVTKGCRMLGHRVIEVDFGKDYTRDH